MLGYMGMVWGECWLYGNGVKRWLGVRHMANGKRITYDYISVYITYI